MHAKTRLLTVAGLVLGLWAATPGMMQAEVLTTRVVANGAETLGLHIPMNKRVYMTYREAPPSTHIINSGYILSYADLDLFKTAARTLPAGTRVLYDLEGWRFSPGYQLRHNLDSMTKFVRTARRYHLSPGLCPAWIILPGGSRYQPGSLSIRADWFVLQVHYGGGRQLAGLVRQVKIQQPGRVYLKLSAIPQHSMDYLLSQWRTARRYIKDFVVWGGRARDPASQQEAVDLIRRIS